MKKAIIITAVALLLIGLALGCWFVLTDSLDFDPEDVASIAVYESTALGGEDFIITDTDDISYVCGSLDRLILLPYKESYANGYYYDLTLLDNMGNKLVSLRLRNNKSIVVGSMTYNADVSLLRSNLDNIKNGSMYSDGKGALALQILAALALIAMIGLPAVILFVIQLAVYEKLDRSVWQLVPIGTVALYWLDRSAHFYTQVVFYLGLGISLDFYFAPELMLAVLLLCQGIAWHISLKNRKAAQ